MEEREREGSREEGNQVKYSTCIRIRVGRVGRMIAIVTEAAQPKHVRGVARGG